MLIPQEFGDLQLHNWQEGINSKSFYFKNLLFTDNLCHVLGKVPGAVNHGWFSSSGKGLYASFAPGISSKPASSSACRRWQARIPSSSNRHNIRNDFTGKLWEEVCWLSIVGFMPSSLLLFVFDLFNTVLHAYWT